MKKFLMTVLMTLFSYTAAASPEHCVLVERNGDNTPFTQVQGVTADRQYVVVQRIVRGILKFELQEGHGQKRLVSYRNGRLVAATSGYSDDDLNLFSQGYEVGCWMF